MAATSPDWINHLTFVDLRCPNLHILATAQKQAEDTLSPHKSAGALDCWCSNGSHTRSVLAINLGFSTQSRFTKQEGYFGAGVTRHPPWVKRCILRYANSRQFSKYETYHFWYGSVTTAPYEVYLNLTLYPQHTQFHYIKDITYRSVVSIPNNEEIVCAHKSNIYSEHLTGHRVTWHTRRYWNHTYYNATYVCQHDREQRRNKRAHVCLNAHDPPTSLLNCTARIHILKLPLSRQIQYI